MGNCQQIQNLKENELKINHKDIGIFIAVKIWSKKSNELFNYEARSYKELKYDLMKQETLPKQLRHLFWRSEDDGLMIFNPNRSFSSGNEKQERSFLSKWVNLSSLDRNNGIEIKVNDVYKFGNTLLKVKDVYFSNHQSKFNNSFEMGNQLCCCNNMNCRKSSTNSGKNGNQQEQQQNSKLDKSCQKQSSSGCNQNGKCSRCQNNCQGNGNGSNITGNNNSNNNWIVMQKATTMMLSSKYQGTEEYNEDLDESICESNCGQCNVSAQQSENGIGVTGEKNCNQGCSHATKKSKKSQLRLHSQGENQKQCRICLCTEDEEKSCVSADQMWQSIQKQTEDQQDNSVNLVTHIIQHQSNVKDNQTLGQDLNHTCYSNYNITSNNPMISICGCQGSMKYVHLKCLQTWVKSKQQLNDAFSSKFCEYYSQKAMICELCKKNYPLKININGKKIFLLQMEDDDLEEGTKQMYPASTASRQESNVNQQSMMNQNSQANILQIDNEDDDNDHVRQDIQEEQEDEDGEEENNNSPFENHQDDNDDEEDNNDDEDDDQEENEDNDDEEEEEEQKTDWDNQTNQKKREKKKKSKSFDNYVIFEISNSQNTSLNGLIILNLSKSFENQSTKTTNIINHKKSSTLKTIFTLGRQNSCDIKINDITVSRFHAELKVDYDKGRVFLKDTNSKFGTLIKLRKELVINTKLDGVQVQINNVCLEFCIGQDPQQEYYQRQIQSKNNNNKNDKSNTCKFSTCCKTTNISKNDQEINLQDITFKFRDKDYHPIHQLHDSVFRNPQDISYQH